METELVGVSLGKLDVGVASGTYMYNNQSPLLYSLERKGLSQF